MKVLVTGSSGMVGSALVAALERDGVEVVRLVRGEQGGTTRTVGWDPQTERIDSAGLEGADALVHLAGESIASGRPIRPWTPAKKARIRDSRVLGTRLLARTLPALSRRPSVWVCASAIGYYGDRGDEWLEEGAQAGRGFLAEVCRDWEEATRPAADAGIRVVSLRIGVVLSRKGGALAKMLLPFRLGLGGRVGSGRQYMSWIALDELVEVIRFAIREEHCRGPINAVSPSAVTNLEFTRVLGKVLFRPTLFPMPALAVRTIFGEMGQELLLSSTRVRPARLAELGYSFRWPELEGALRRVLAS